MITGMSNATGKHLSGINHLHQSIRDILSTRLGTRVMRRTYGSRIPELVDAPLNEATKMDVYTATVEALAIWEPRVVVSSMSLRTADAAGVVTMDLIGTYDGAPFATNGIIL